MTKKKKDAINPKHYKSHPSKIEAIEICEYLGFNIGNAVKYLFRAGLKNNTVEDLKKALWYLRRAVKNHRWWTDIYMPSKLSKLMKHEPVGQVLGDVLRVVFDGDELEPAVVRVEAEIAKYTTKKRRTK